MSENRIYVEPAPLKLRNCIMIILGSAMYAASVNLFLQPLNLYAGGIPGTAQVIARLFFQNVHGIDVTGIVNLCLNLPLFFLAFRAMHKRMLIGTILSILTQTIVFTLVRIPSAPILDDMLASILIAGIAAGVGCGVVLTNGGSAGGTDLLGVYITTRVRNFSVGTLNLIYNAVFYTYTAMAFTLSTSIYSILFVAAFAVTIDRFHYQNIAVELMIFTHHPEMADTIMTKYVRGVTEWNGVGAYTNKDTHVLVTVVAKNEVDRVMKDIQALDPQAFIITHEHIKVAGGYQKRLEN